VCGREGKATGRAGVGSGNLGQKERVERERFVGSRQQEGECTGRQRSEGEAGRQSRLSGALEA